MQVERLQRVEEGQVLPEAQRLLVAQVVRRQVEAGQAALLAEPRTECRQAGAAGAALGVKADAVA